MLTRDCSVGVARKRKTYAVSFAAIAALIAAPFVTADDSCSIAKGGDGSFTDDVRAWVYQVKLRFGLAKPPMVMGKISALPPPSSGP